ncbi:hypothetical protein GCM10018791_26340 [Streptomyces zaomyceticus]|nr:hypothetical protein GCM10018791_26340 [Streptomyces zaomyceticus]
MASAQGTQKLHSYEQIRAGPSGTNSAVPHRSHRSRISRAMLGSPPGTRTAGELPTAGGTQAVPLMLGPLPGPPNHVRGPMINRIGSGVGGGGGVGEWVTG